MRFTKTIASASVAAVIGLGGVSVAGATSGASSQSPTAAVASPTAAGTSVATKHARRAIRRHRLRQAGAIAATTMHITPAELLKELRTGKTIAQVATDNGSSPQAVIDALETAATKKIEAAKTAGKISAERAAKLEARFAKAIPKLVNNWHLRQAAAG